jgi:hypothetical protein
LSPIETRFPEVTQLDTQRLLKTLAMAAGLALTAAIPASASPTAVTFPSGSWQGNGQGTRVFTCADGSGTFTASFDGELEHMTGASGPWAIVSGTGEYLTLRGRGAATVDFSTGPNGSPITFSDTWQGVVDFDNVAPAIKVQRATATRLRSPRGRYQLRLSFICPDNVIGNTVSYTVVVSTAAGTDLAKRAGKTTAGATLSLRIRPPRRARFINVELTATDPVGNLRTITRRVRLGRQQK